MKHLMCRASHPPQTEAQLQHHCLVGSELLADPIRLSNAGLADALCGFIGNSSIANTQEPV
jgi:hypothetical protein